MTITPAPWTLGTHPANHGLVKSAYAVETLHGFYGHMPVYLNQIRDEVGNRIESFLSADEKQAFDNVR